MSTVTISVLDIIHPPVFWKTRWWIMSESVVVTLIYYCHKPIDLTWVLVYNMQPQICKNLLYSLQSGFLPNFAFYLNYIANYLYNVYISKFSIISQKTCNTYKTQQLVHSSQNLWHIHLCKGKYLQWTHIIGWFLEQCISILNSRKS